MTTRTKLAEVTSEHARIKFSDLLDATQHHDGQILITRHDKPAGLLVPPYVNIPHAYDWAAAQQAYDRAANLPNPYTEMQAAYEALGRLLGIYYGYDQETS